MRQLELALYRKRSRIKDVPMDSGMKERLVQSMAAMIAAVARETRRPGDDASGQRAK